MTTTAPTQTLPERGRFNFWRYLVSPQHARDLGYMLLTLPASIISFTLLVTGVSVTLSLIVFIVGIFVFLGFSMINRGWANLQRMSASLVLGERIASVYRPRPKSTSDLLGRTKVALADAQTWRDGLWLMFDGTVGFVFGVITISAWGYALASVTLPIWYWSLPEDADPISYGFFSVDSTSEAFIAVAIGIVLIPIAAGIVRGMALGHAHVARSLLGPQSTARIEQLETTRAGAVDAAQEELHRIERDLHDGAQARLVALSMDLGMAEKKMADDPEGSRELVEQAREQALQTLQELRDLVRGIAPSILRDRGLSAAVASLASRHAPPIVVDVMVDSPRPSAPVETAAYFVVAESIANATKHGPASRIGVRARRDAEFLYVTVEDDGPGGAKLVPGGGLDGLAKRVAALDGKLSVVSPPGGPTMVSAQIPCV
jgi:signal transduction histidine kinase